MIVINGRFLEEPGRGVYRFASQITSHLMEIRRDVRVVAPSGARNKSPHIPSNSVDEIGQLHGHLWEQITLPRYLFSAGKPLLINLANRSPLAYSRQISTIHDIIPIRYPDVFPWSYNTLFRIFLHAMARHRQIITVSDFSKQEIASTLHIHPSRISVISNAPDTDTLAPNKNSDKEGSVKEMLAIAPERFILGFSSMSANKNGGVLVSAHSIYAASTPDPVPLVLVGKDSQKLEQARGRHSRPELVTLLENVDDQMLGRLYKGATLFVFPSLYEGFGIPPIEAQSFGTPVVAGDIPVMRETLEDSASLVDMNHPEVLATALSNLLVDRTSLSTLSSKGLKNIQRYTWAQSARRLSAVADKLLRSEAS